MQYDKTINFANTDLHFSFNTVAGQADASVLAKNRDNVLLTTICISDAEKYDIDYLPLSVHYQERKYAAGLIAIGFEKREGRQKEHEIIISRLIDRPLRPNFAEWFCHEMQIVSTLLSFDPETSIDWFAINCASLTALISKAPFSRPIGAVNIAEMNGHLILNPDANLIEKCNFYLIVAADNDGIVMLEGYGKQINDALLLEMIAKAFDQTKVFIRFQQNIVRELNTEKLKKPDHLNDALRAKIENDYSQVITDILLIRDNYTQKAELKKLLDQINQNLNNEKKYSKYFIKSEVNSVISQIFRKNIVDKKKRFDDRSFTDLRPIKMDTGFLPRVHGSALFTRGETQSLATLTMGTPLLAQKLDDLYTNRNKNFFLHYNFLPFSVGELGQIGTVKRREIGHSTLAERALVNILPDSRQFFCTLRLVSEILSSNGSSSMASVCSGSLCLMDAGVPLESHAAGIAMGLVTGGNDYVLLTDINELEDHFGDMDFKVAGTNKGITAIQVDIKIDHLSMDIIKNALNQAKQARFKIISKMINILPEARHEFSPYTLNYETIPLTLDLKTKLFTGKFNNLKKIGLKTNASLLVKKDKLIIFTDNRLNLKKCINQIQQLSIE